MPITGYFDVVFGVSGTRTAVPDAIQIDGSVNYTEGYGIDYELDPATNPSALEIGRAQMNQLFYDITTAIQYQQQGLPAPFITSAMNNGSPFSYGQYATVTHGGVAYISNVSGNTDTPPSSKWNVVNISSPNQFIGSTITGTANAIVVGSITPPAGLSLAVDGQTLVITPTADNSGSTTVAVTPASITATLIKKVSGASLVNLTGGELVNGVAAYLSTNSAVPCFVLQAGPALGTMAPLNIGNNMANDTTGNAVGTVPSSALTGANQTFALAQWGALIARSNSGTAMADTLPGTSGALPAGWYIQVQNTDATAGDIVSVGAGGTIFMGNQNLTTPGFPILPGETYLIVSQGSGNYEIQRSSASTLHASPNTAAALNLKSVVTGNATATITADYITLQDSNGNTRRISAVNASLNAAGTGANGIDTGALAANTWYYEYIIYKPSTGTVACLLSLSATAPTLPAGYTYTKCFGELRTDGSAHFIGTLQQDSDVQYLVGTNLTASRQMISGSSGNVTTPTWTAQAVASFVPPTAIRIRGYLGAIMASPSIGAIAAPNNSYGGSQSSITNYPPCAVEGTSASGNGGGVMFDWILESANVYYASAVSTAALFCIGWKTKLV